MYELIALNDHDFYVESPTKVGLVKINDTHVIAIDSGNDKDAAKKVKKHLDANGWELTAVFNTHSHADHIGGNRYLQNQTGCQIYAGGFEQPLACHPMLEPILLYGANPVKELKNKFFLAEESKVLPLTQEVLPEGWKTVPLPGHYFDMVGFQTPRNVVYLADCLASQATLEKYQIVYILNVAEYLHTLEQIKTMEADWFVPAHAPATQDIAGLAQINIDKSMEIARVITDLCKEPKPYEELLCAVFEHYALPMNPQQHALVGSTIKAYLSWLQEQNILQTAVDGYRLLWERK